MLDDNFSWIEFVRQDDEFWRAVRGNLIAFIALDPTSGNANHLGAGFIIGQPFDVPGIGNGYITVLTAKHVLEEAYKEQDIAKFERRPEGVSPFLFDDRLSIDEDKLRAIWMGTSIADMMRVRHVTYAHNQDIAVCILEPQEEFKSQVLKEISATNLDVRIPAIGDTVHIVRLTDYDLNGEILTLGKISTTKNRPFIRKATVLSHESSAMGHYGPCFRVSCPTVAGMSGGFVYIPGSNGSPIGACGIISSSPTVENPNHFSTIGDTLIVPTLGTLGLELPFNKNPLQKLRIIDLIHEGGLKDITYGYNDFDFIEFQDGSYKIRVK